MKRIEEKFAALRAKKEKALIVYLTAGDPSLDMTKKLIFGLEKAGVDILEIGVPFSDPTADGPVIQAASQRALKAGTTLAGVLKMVSDVRKVSEIPIVLFGYFNPIFAYGVKKFALDARKAGVDGVLVVDLPYEEAGELRIYTDASQIDFISLIAPTTDKERLSKIAASAAGFLYYISITGITGTATPKIDNIKTEVGKIRKITKLPIAVGFGISKPQQAKEIARFADGVVIGSAVVRLIDENKNNRDLVEIISGYVSEIKQAL
ncbi:MAG: tryptophan synthase subunit alpha [Deltaproteobacteria bacterium HGW-Deltaproteobacteria-7]|nr:MAG: tryptophan synthase subunit alpha [Deltaproteobacteria bacterium HGW-Deltaproteobacteria-7]PKN51288.1 MAG: tryptophan synthase subunit alpha [Deltaproteobacteria bacterium HGW-Deltaproteobacteria-13]